MKFRMSMLFNFSLLLVVLVVYGNYLHSHSSAAAGAAFDQFVKCLNHGVVQVRGDFWNDGGLIRFSHPLLNTPNSLVVEIGGNAGRDSLEFLTRYKSIDYFTLEPMPDYIKILNSKLVDTKLIPADHILQYGVDRLDGNFTFCEDGNLGEATSAFRIPKTCKQSLVLPVRRGSDALKEIMKVAGKDEIDLLTLNCEGCEYGFFESLIEENMLKKIKIIQYARHPIITIPNLLARSCRIQEHLAMSHYVKYEYQFLWEAWYRHQQTHQ